MKLMSIAVASLVAFCIPSTGQELKNPAPTVQGDSLASERRELAEIQLLLGADRKYAEAKERLAKLAESLAKRTDKEAKTLLGQVEQLDRNVRRALGEPVPSDLSLLVETLTTSARAISGDSLWRDKYKTGDTVDEAVLYALSRADYSFVNELGMRAGPGLEQAVRGGPDAFPGNVSEDPLYLLLKLDPRRGDELLSELLEHDSFFWRKRVVRALGEARPWNGKALFSTEIPRTLEKYAIDPDVGNSALASLGSLGSAGSRSEEFPRLIGEALRSSDPLRRDAAKGVVRNGTFPLVRPILEAALEDEDADLRRFASSVLSKHPESRVLLAHADDPDPEVRRQVLRCLEKSERKDWGREEQAVLAKLLLDGDAEVRDAAWKILRGFPTEKRTTTLPAERGFTGEALVFEREVYAAPLPDEAYRSLQRSSSSARRSQLATIARFLPEPLCFELCAALAGDSDASVRSATAEVLPSLPSWSDPEATLRIVAALRADAATHRSQVWAMDALRPVSGTRAGLAALAPWIVARNEVELSDLVDVQSLARIDAGLFADYVTWLFDHVLLDMRNLDGRSEAMLALAKDRSRPLVLRLLTLEMVCEVRALDEGLATAVDQVMADPGWSAFDQEKNEGLETSMHKLVEELRGEARNRAIAVLLENAACPEWLSVWSISAFDRWAPGAVAIGKRVLERWLAREDHANSAVQETIEAMAAVPELRDDRVLAEATRRNAYAYTAWNTIAALKDPAFLPLIRAALEERGEPKAAEALFGYLSDEAAELLLLAAARVQSTELRDQCLAHLEKIREYQDSRERWATRKVKTATREQVVAQLVEQLSSKSDEVKVQAIRALATWEAVEVMPKLIELTTSGSKSVAAAAREALERLNAPKKE